MTCICNLPLRSASIRHGFYNLYMEIWSRTLFVSLPHLFPLHKVLFWHEEVCQFINMSQNILGIILFLQQTHHWWNFFPLSITTFYWNSALVILPSNYCSLQDFPYLFRYISDHPLINIVSPMFCLTGHYALKSKNYL